MVGLASKFNLILTKIRRKDIVCMRLMSAHQKVTPDCNKDSINACFEKEMDGCKYKNDVLQ